jgi:hypothetical protein
MPESDRGLPHSKTWRNCRRTLARASVPECARPLALSRVLGVSLQFSIVRQICIFPRIS